MMSFFCVVAVILVLFYRLWRIRRLLYLSRLIPSSYTAWPFFGHLYMLIGNDEAKMTAIIRFSKDALKKGGITSVWLFSRLQVVIADPILADVVLKSCLEKDDLLDILQIFTGNGSIFAPAKIWRPRRRKVVRVFNMKNLKQFVEIIGRQSGIMVDQLRLLAGCGPVSIVKYIKKTSLCTVCETALGVQVGNQGDLIIKAIRKCVRMTCYLLFRPFLQYKFLYKNLPMWTKFLMERDTIYSFINMTVSLKQKSRRQADDNIVQCKYLNTETRQDLAVKSSNVLDLLLKPNFAHTFSEVELCEEILVMIFAGTETMSVALSLVCVMLAKHFDEQEKVYQEIKEVFGNTTKPPTMNELLRLKYLEIVIKETLRLYPPGPIIMRKADKDVMLPSGLTLVKGCGIVISAWGIHRNPAYWGSDADQFRPERFLENPPSHPASYLPFSYGPRNCIGQQYSLVSMKTTLSTLLRNYRILPEGSTLTGHTNIHKDGKPLRVKYNVILNHVDNYVVELESRL